MTEVWAYRHATGQNAPRDCKRKSRLDLSAIATNLRPIIDEIANRADGFLAGATDRSHARAGIEEVITMDYAGLNPLDRSLVVTGVMVALEEEDFFGTEFVGDPFGDEDEPERPSGR